MCQFIFAILSLTLLDHAANKADLACAEIPGTILISNSRNPSPDFKFLVKGLISGELSSEQIAGVRRRQLASGQVVQSDSIVAICSGDTLEENGWLRWLDDGHVSRISVLPFESAIENPQQSLLPQVATATVVILVDAELQRLDSSNFAILSTDLQVFLQRGGTLIALGRSIEGLGEKFLGGDELSKSSAGANLVPGVCFKLPDQSDEDLAAIVDHQSGLLGLALESGAAMLIHSRTIQTLSPAKIQARLGACDYRAAETIAIGRQADLTQLRRAAIARKRNVDPGKTTSLPALREGALVIVGGGELPTEIGDKFIELAGGEKAEIVVLPTAVPPSQVQDVPMPTFLTRAKLTSLTMLPQRGASEVEGSDFQNALRRATGIWFGGGRQWNFVDAYENTSAIELFHAVLQRGGVIGGSSAGATIQGEYLVRGHPLGNTVMMAEGYERGFGFLPGTAIDQHFSQRNRFCDLLTVVQRHPGLLGIGIDEATALVVQGHQAKVIGRNSVHLIRGEQLNTLSVQQLEIPFQCFEHYETDESFSLISTK